MDRAITQALTQALKNREVLLENLCAETTNAYRLFYGTSEGIPGLTIDRYGALILVQTFYEPITQEILSTIENVLREKLLHAFVFAYKHRGKSLTPLPKSFVESETQCQEFGLHYLYPWFFLDLRVGRRFLRESAKGASVLNLFSYTCSAGICAAAGGASEVWNVDFASSNLEVGRKNALLNKNWQIEDNRFRFIHEDCLPVMRQLAGLHPGGRHNRMRKFKIFEQREFDFVFLDPPAWSKGSFGAVDVASDYPGLFKSAVLIAKPKGGRIIATNHVPSVGLDTWIEVLKRCAAKAGRPISSLQTLTPESDFPSFDGRPPLKIVVCEV